MKRIIKYHWQIAAALLLLSVFYITHPLIFNISSLTTGAVDELLIAWIQNWVLHSIITNPTQIFQANIYYPFTNTLAYSETFITSSILASVVKLFTDEPIATVNFTFITSLFTLGLSIYLLTYYITRDFSSSLLASLLVVFSPAVLSYSTHLQVLGIAGVPLAILFFTHYLRTSQLRFIIFACVMLVLQMYNSFLPGYFILVSWIIITVSVMRKDKKVLKRFFNLKVGLILFLSCVTLLPIVYPYLLVSQEFKYARDIRESIHNAFQVEDFLYPGETTRLNYFLRENVPTNQYSQNNEFKPGYLGATFSLLSLFSLLIIFRKRKDLLDKTLPYLGIGITAFIISLGPALHFNRHTVHDPFPIPLPYALLYYVLPGFQGFRTPARWEMLLIIVLAILIAIVLVYLLKRVTVTKRIIIYTLLSLSIIGEFNFPINYVQAPVRNNFPEVYSWIQTTPKDSVIIEMPIYTWDMQPYVFDENLREFYSTMHFRKMVNGASGFSPEPWQSIVKDLLNTFPNDRAVTKLSSMDVDYIIVHKNEYDRLYKDAFSVADKRILNGDAVIANLNKNKSLKLIKQFDQDYVYQIVK